MRTHDSHVAGDVIPEAITGDPAAVSPAVDMTENNYRATDTLQ